MASCDATLGWLRDVRFDPATGRVHGYEIVVSAADGEHPVFIAAGCVRYASREILHAAPEVVALIAEFAGHPV